MLERGLSGEYSERLWLNRTLVLKTLISNKEKTRVAKLFGYPGFWVVDMFDWLLVGLAALDQHDEGYHYERCSRCCCGGD